MLLRPESPPDFPAIHRVHSAAFGSPAEADLVDALRAQNHALLGLVAEINETVAGHVLFSRMWIETPNGTLNAVALAPIAVLPEHQNKGVGSQLIRRGLRLLRERGEQIVLVLGHAHYYTRFGFSVEAARDLQSPFPKDAYLAIHRTAIPLQGKVIYPAPFGL